MTFEVLKEISAPPLRFFKCHPAEIVYEEKHKVWHAKSIAGRRLATSGWKEKTARKPDWLDALETAGPEALARLTSRIRAEKRHDRSPKRLFIFPAGRRPGAGGVKDQPVRQAFLMIPAGRSVSGVVVLSFAHGRTADEDAAEWLERLAAVVGRSLSHNLARFELRERVKELTCMHNIANLAMTSDPNTDRFLQ